MKRCWHAVAIVYACALLAVGCPLGGKASYAQLADIVRQAEAGVAVACFTGPSAGCTAAQAALAEARALLAREYPDGPPTPPSTTTTTTQPQQPTPTTLPQTPPPPVTLPPAGAGCDLDQLINEHTPMTGLGEADKPTLPAQLVADLNAVGAELSGCSPGSDCIVGPYDTWVPKMAAGLRARGWCVGMRIHPDALAISDPADLTLNYAVHVWTSGNRARWLPKAYVDAWRLKEAPSTPPATVPPAPSACPAPRWETFVDPSSEGSCGFTWGLVPKCWRAEGGTECGLDATLNVRKCCGFCAAIGLAVMPDGHTIRCNCPLRNEDKPAERIACEHEVGAVWKARNGRLILNRANPAQAACDGEGCELQVCTKSGTCSDWRRP
jgi:hypothetical protein